MLTFQNIPRIGQETKERLDLIEKEIKNEEKNGKKGSLRIMKLRELQAMNGGFNFSDRDLMGKYASPW